MMLCPSTFNGVCGEDFDSPPYHSFWSGTCTCENLASDHNQFMWLHYEDASPAEPTTWGSIKTLFW